MKTLNISHRVLGSVKFRCDIVDAKSGRTVKRGTVQRNLIFDYGLDNLATRSWVDLFEYFVLGTGTTATRRDSGIVTVSQSGNTATASAGFFEAGDVGRLLKYDSGEERYITAFSSSTSVTVGGAPATIAAAEATVYYVNRNSLGAEVKRTSTRTSDTGDHGRSYNGATGVLSTWKTQIFSAESGTVTYKEIGWSHANTGASTINGGALIAGGGDTLVAGQQYKVKLQLDRVISPKSARALAASDVVDAWTGTANEVIESMHFTCWDTNGSSSSPTNYNSLEPGAGNTLQVGTDATALRPVSAINTNVTRNGLSGEHSITFDSYVAGSFKRDGSAVWESTEANSSALRSAFISGGGGWCAHAVLFDSDQSKLSSQKLTLRFRKSWGRVLVN